MKAKVAVIFVVGAFTTTALAGTAPKAHEMEVVSPSINFLDDTGDKERTEFLSAIKSFVNAAVQNDRTAAREYAMKAVYNSRVENRTRLFEYWLDLFAEQGKKAKWIYVTHLREVRFNDANAFATTVLVFDCGGEGNTKTLMMAPIDMVWVHEESGYHVVVLSDIEPKIVIKSGMGPD